LALNANLILLIVELILLVPTLLLLVLGRREERGRAALLTEITKTAKMLTRQEYFNSVLYGMQSATSSIRGSITGSVPATSQDEELVSRIVGQIIQCKRNQKQLVIRYLLPRSQDRLSVASRYTTAGAQVRFHRSLIVSDLRYMVVDGKISVIGIPKSAGDDQPTREGYVLPSEELGEIISENFEKKWSEAAPYEEYAREVLSEITSTNPNVSDELLSGQLKVPVQEIIRMKQVGKSETVIT
jgi:hypothetical protein